MIWGVGIGVVLNGLVAAWVWAHAVFPYGPQWVLVFTVPGLGLIGLVFVVIGSVKAVQSHRTPKE